ncbi:MAG: hypothetical protein COA79_10980 [Planctomycetota bacterium]|nr:MAG: hypothetical protein COA79_10980 [Planctomycetota bacterium]
MKCNLRFEVNTEISKNSLVSHITKVLGFYKKGRDKYTTKGSKFTVNPNAVDLEINTSLYPLISISGNSWFLKKRFLDKLINDFYLNNFKEMNAQLSPTKTIFTSIDSFSFNQLAILISRYLFPISLIFVISFLTFISLSHEVMLGVYQEVLIDLDKPGLFNNDYKIRPMFFEVYDQSDIWFGSLLLSLLGGGIPFALKNIFCVLLIRNSTFLSKRPFLFLFLFFLLLSSILTPKPEILIFSFILGIGILLNYFIFSWMLKSQPYFAKYIK